MFGFGKKDATKEASTGRSTSTRDQNEELAYRAQEAIKKMDKSAMIAELKRVSSKQHFKRRTKFRRTPMSLRVGTGHSYIYGCGEALDYEFFLYYFLCIEPMMEETVMELDQEIYSELTEEDFEEMGVTAESLQEELGIEADTEDTTEAAAEESITETSIEEDITPIEDESDDNDYDRSFDVPEVEDTTKSRWGGGDSYDSGGDSYDSGGYDSGGDCGGDDD